jgi:serine protease Do
MRGLGEVAERLRRSTVQVFSDPKRGGGSGIVWNADGLIVTNAHVARSSQAEVELWDGRRATGRVISRDPRRDLASLQIDLTGLEAATAADSDAIRPGEIVLAIGSPLGFAGALSSGVIHSVGTLPGMGPQKWIRAGVRLAPGNSGGPLANANGEVIGINTAIANGLGVAAPSNRAADFLRRGPRPALGVTMRQVELGLLLLEVDEGGAAAEASLRAGDLLLITFDDLNDALDSGRNVLRLQFFRGDRTRVREAFVNLGHKIGAAA